MQVCISVCCLLLWTSKRTRQYFIKLSFHFTVLGYFPEGSVICESEIFIENRHLYQTKNLRVYELKSYSMNKFVWQKCVLLDCYLRLTADFCFSWSVSLSVILSMGSSSYLLLFIYEFCCLWEWFPFWLNLFKTRGEAKPRNIFQSK